MLFQAALCAERCNPEIARFAARLRARGKPHKQVVIASARKLLLLANAVLKRGTPSAGLSLRSRFQTQLLDAGPKLAAPHWQGA